MQYKNKKKLIVHPRISQRHPEVSAQDVRAAWDAAIVSQSRAPKEPDEYVVVGIDERGRTLEMVGRRLQDGRWLVYHAMTPPSKRTIQELGL